MILLILFHGELEAIEKSLVELSKRQNNIENKMGKVEKIVDSIEKDIYLDNEYDLEIVCPYCNYSFSLDSDEIKNEIECPECKNIIELDWNDDLTNEGCSGSCGSCFHGCNNQEDDEDM